MRSILILTAVLLIGCADSKAKTEKQTITIDIVEMCIGGVVYIRTSFWERGYMSVKLGRDSKVVLCEE